MGAKVNSPAGLKIKIGSFTKNCADADQATSVITGVGFKAKAVIFFAYADDNNTLNTGLDDGITAVGSAVIQGLTACTGQTNQSIRIHPSSGNNQVGHITTMGNDGFTVTWTKTGTPTSIATILYLAIS